MRCEASLIICSQPHAQVLGSWMTKIDALLRRLLLLREQAPDEKALVFSQFREALDLVRGLQALIRFLAQGQQI